MAVAGLTLLAIVGLIVWRSSAVTISASDVGWLADDSTIAGDAAVVYTRYLSRHRRHRLAGGLFGVAFAVVYGIRWSGSVSVGIGQNSPLSDVLFCGLAGVLIGVLSAESFRLTRRPPGIVAASLDQHDDYRTPRTDQGSRALLLLAVLVGAVVRIASGAAAPMLIAIAGIGFALLAAVTQRAISARARPVLSDSARRVDARLRGFAAQSVTTLRFASSILVLGWAVSKAPRSSSGLVEVLRAVFVIGCLVAALVLLRRAAPRPSRRWAGATL